MKPLTSDLQLKRLRLSGFKSIELCDLELGGLNVLIGANGAGKSNLLSVFDLIKALVTGNLQRYILINAGCESMLHYGSKNTDKFIIKLSFEQFMYEASFTPAGNDKTLIDETLSSPNARLIIKDINQSQLNKVTVEKESSDKNTLNEKIDYYRSEIPFPSVSNKGYESIAKAMSEELYWLDQENPNNTNPVKPRIETKKAVQSLIHTANQFRVYHFNDTSDSARIKKHNQVNDNIYFRSDGSNLTAFLYLLKQVYPKSYSQIVDTIKIVAPFFHDFHLRPEPVNNEIIMLEWFANGYDQPFKAFQLSDGTLRFICLATALLQPDEYLSQTIVIDEPELGLHPDAIHILAGLIRSVSKSRQLIISTQSVDLLSEFDPEDVILVDYQNGKSTFKRPDLKFLESWLKNYSLGELWLKNVLSLGDLK